MHNGYFKRQKIMIRFYLVPVLGLYLLCNACTHLIASDTDSDTDQYQEQQSDKAESTSKPTSKTSNSVLDEALSAIVQANETALSASKAVEDIIDIKKQLKEMSTDAGDTLNAVHSENYKMAQYEFSQLQKNWNKIKYIVKRHSPHIYQEVNTHLTTIDTLLKQPHQNHTKLTHELSLFVDKYVEIVNIVSRTSP